jgi:hypothetical protein
MLTISERKALHEGFRQPSGLGHVGRQVPRIYQSPGATVSAPVLAQRIGPTSYDNSRDTARGVVYGVLISVAIFWLPLAVWVFG